MKAIPNFSTLSLKGEEIINNVTGAVKKFKTGTNKYQLFDDKKKSHTLTIAQIKLLVAEDNVHKAGANVEKAKKEAKPAKEKAVKKEAAPKKAAAPKEDKGLTKKEQILALHKEGKTPAEIEELTGIKANTAFVAIKIHRIMSMHAKGKTPEEIAEKTGYKVDSVKWQIEKSAPKK